MFIIFHPRVHLLPSYIHLELINEGDKMRKQPGLKEKSEMGFDLILDKQSKKQ